MGVIRIENELRFAIENLIDPQWCTSFGITFLEHDGQKTVLKNALEMAIWLEQKSDNITTCSDIFHLAPELKGDLKNPNPAEMGLKPTLFDLFKERYFQGAEEKVLYWISGKTIASTFNANFIENNMEFNLWDQALTELKNRGISERGLNLEITLSRLRKTKKGDFESPSMKELRYHLTQEHNNRPIDKIRNFQRILTAHKIMLNSDGEVHSFFSLLSALGWKGDDNKELQIILSS
ncbi:unnamed protein product [Oikopleura dioica]|uniref:Uncharacterized protein n=1 Tax=Oikopleura dioica TaxID=34765 RepID=E4XL97_OIKDI|nr:unnamed protein product [Oikopleura dioica]